MPRVNSFHFHLFIIIALPDSNTFQFNYVALEKFNRDVAKKLEKGGSTAEKILQRLEDVRSRVLASQMNIHFAGDKISLKNDANWLFLQNNASKEPLEVFYSL